MIAISLTVAAGAGADVVHARDNPTIYPAAHWGPGSDITALIAGWNRGREPQGTL